MDDCWDKDDLDLTREDLAAMIRSGEPVELVGPPIGWTCPHFTVTSIPGVLGRPTHNWCGCAMEPLHATR